MGYNNDGQLGDGSYNNTNLPEQIVASNVTAIAAGYYHSLFLKTDGSLWAMGGNYLGQLGDGTYNNTNLPEQIVAPPLPPVITTQPSSQTNYAGATVNFLVSATNSLPIFYQWQKNGANLVNEGNISGSTNNTLTIRVISQNDTANYSVIVGNGYVSATSSNASLTVKVVPVTKIAAGHSFSLFIKSDGSLWGMGFSYDGELGDGIWYANAPSMGGIYGPTNAEQIIASNITAIAAGYYHSLFLKSDGSLWATGDDQYGELGDGNPYGGSIISPEMIVASNVTAITAGGYHSLFLKGDGRLWGMGENDSGQLGDGTYNNTNRPEQIVASNVVAIAASSRGHSLFLKNDGSLWGMGWNTFGQLGDGTYNNTNHPEQIVASNVIAIAAGAGHSLFLKSDGSLWGMGENDTGQLGDGTYATNYPYGTNRPEQIVASNVTAIAAGYIHSLFVKSGGSLWGMGGNGGGQLGDGTYNNNNRPEQIVTNNVTAISAGVSHSLFLKSDGSLWGMGDDHFDELGDGLYSTNLTAFNGSWGIIFGTNSPEQIVAGVPPGYYQISGQLLTSGDLRLSFIGIAGANYALDRSFSLSPAYWLPQTTNSADSFGVLLFTNTPDPTTNNFWRIRSVP